MNDDHQALARREFLRQLFLSAGGVCAATLGPVSLARAQRPAFSLADIGALLPPDANGIRLPAGFSSRVVAVSGQRPVAGGNYTWHGAPDGGAAFASPDGGWVYANNSELGNSTGGVGALRFNAAGQVVNAYRILSGTSVNCAGGPTPWQTWLSCEEHATGQVWECDPFGVVTASARPALGIFRHEAAAVDPVNKVVYLTEDEPTGRFYRFVCSVADWPANAARPALKSGTLQVLKFNGLANNAHPADGLDLKRPHPVQWVDVVDPVQPQSTVRTAMGNRAPGTIFNGGEGLWYFKGIAYFATKGDNRIWAHDIAQQTLQVIYDFATASAADRVLSGVDNLTVSRWGDVLVAEDGGNMELCMILPNRQVKVLLRVEGQDSSEITGPAFSPDGRRLYFNSQRGGLSGSGLGITYEVMLPA